MLKNKLKLSLTRFSFGATSSIITSLGLITGLDGFNNPKTSIISGLLLIALADNISDTLGIHIYQESEAKSPKEIWFSTLSNFFTRLLVSLIFIGIVWFLPIEFAVISSIIFGFFVLTIISFVIAKSKNKKPLLSIIEHIGIAATVIVVSHLVSRFILVKI